MIAILYADYNAVTADNSIRPILIQDLQCWVYIYDLHVAKWSIWMDYSLHMLPIKLVDFRLNISAYNVHVCIV